jgi:hypothetical protein
LVLVAFRQFNNDCIQAEYDVVWLGPASNSVRPPPGNTISPAATQKTVARKKRRDGETTMLKMFESFDRNCLKGGMYVKDFMVP